MCCLNIICGFKGDAIYVLGFCRFIHVYIGEWCVLDQFFGPKLAVKLSSQGGCIGRLVRGVLRVDFFDF